MVTRADSQPGRFQTSVCQLCGCQLAGRPGVSLASLLRFFPRLGPAVAIMRSPEKAAAEAKAAERRRPREGRRGLHHWPDGSHYDGYLVDGFRHGRGKFTWPTGEYYEGSFYKDYRHGDGEYCWPMGHKFIGKFYLNRKEGYGRQLFPDGAQFQGLYHANQRFGPGALTYADGNQDVGLWLGDQLLKLCSSVEDGFSLGDFPDYAVYMEAPTMKEALSQPPVHFSLLQTESRPDSGVDADLFSDEEFILPSDTENYCTDADHLPLPPGRRRELDQLFYGKLWEPYPYQGYEREPLTGLPLQERMLAHIHKHRRLVATVDLDVSAVLSSNREGFGPKGPLEIQSELLVQCASRGQLQAVKQILRKGFVHPDVADSRGHTALIAATVNCHDEVIHLLLDKGVDIDKLNCEGMSALAVCYVLYYPCPSLIASLVKPPTKTQAAKSRISQLNSRASTSSPNNRAETTETTLSNHSGLGIRSDCSTEDLPDLPIQRPEETPEEVEELHESKTKETPVEGNGLQKTKGTVLEDQEIETEETPAEVKDLQEHQTEETPAACEDLQTLVENEEAQGIETQETPVEVEELQKSKTKETVVEDEEPQKIETEESPAEVEDLQEHHTEETPAAHEELQVRETEETRRPERQEDMAVEEELETIPEGEDWEESEGEETAGTQEEKVALTERSIQVMDGHIILGNVQWKSCRVKAGGRTEPDDDASPERSFDSACSTNSDHIQVTEDLIQMAAEALSHPGIRQHGHTQETLRKMAAMKTEHRIRLSTLKLLLERGADPNASRVPMPVLFLAIVASDAETVERLLLRGARTDIPLPPEMKGLYPLHVAAALPGPAAPAITQLLLLHAITDPDAQACDQDHIYEPDRAASDPVKMEPLQEAASPEEQPLPTEGGRTALHVACQRDSDYANASRVVALLLSHGARTDLLWSGHSPLSLAIASGNDLAVQELLKGGADPNLPLGHRVGSALCALGDFRYYLGGNRAKLLDMLAKAGADILMPVRLGDMEGTAVDYAHHSFNRDPRIANTPFHALTLWERETLKTRRQLLSMMGNLVRQTAGQREREEHCLELIEGPTSFKDHQRILLPPIDQHRRTTFMFCYHCGRSAAVKLTPCSRCYKVYFCSRKCKLSAWEEAHKKECVRVSASFDGLRRRVTIKTRRGPKLLSKAEKVPESNVSLKENYSCN